MSEKKNPPSPLPPSPLDAQLEERIRALALLLEETGLSEIQIKDSTQDLRVRRQLSAAPLAPAAPAAPRASEKAAADGAPPAEAEPPPAGAVTSPMVGTIYVAPEPGAKPFVQEGDKVKQGDILFIVEAMKTMNNIVAPENGVVQKICVENAQPIEYDEVLAIIA